jgi:hypothetical protein
VDRQIFALAVVVAAVAVGLEVVAAVGLEVVGLGALLGAFSYFFLVVAERFDFPLG